MTDFVRKAIKGLAVSTMALAAAGCSAPMDLDLRGHFNQFSTAEAARLSTTQRPKPDDRGIISYPNYQVVVARRGDTVGDVAKRIGADGGALARHNGLRVDDSLRKGEVLSLPNRVAEPSPETGAVVAGPIQPPGTADISSIAGGAIDRAGDRSVQTAALAPATPAVATPTPQPQTGREPDRHKVARGETAYTIARLYKVSVKALADWNGLDSDYRIREGQQLLIPVSADVGRTAQPAAAGTQNPGVGSPTPVPPSAAKPLPAEKTTPIAKAVEAPKPPAADIGKQTVKSSAPMVYPVKGSIIRDYAKGKNDGIDIKAAPGTAIVAADAGDVAAITSDADNNHVIVVRHKNKLLTIYSNVANITVKEKQKVTRGQKIAEIPSGASPYVHFEVRKGLESTDPIAYLK